MITHYRDEDAPEDLKAEVKAAIDTGLFSPDSAHEIVSFTHFIDTEDPLGFNFIPRGAYLSASKAGYVTRYQASPVQKYCQDDRISNFYWGGARNIPIRAVVALAYRRLKWEANHEPFKDEWLSGKGEVYNPKEIEQLKEKAGWDWTAQDAWDHLAEIDKRWRYVKQD